ncbi:hypothetical protein Q0N58_15265, partial [Staphylococcus aureus]|nr:hypothetical protein [Staphylococcus aureus]
LCFSFQTGRSHLLLVSTKPGRQEGAVGVVTLEDVVEVSGVASGARWQSVFELTTCRSSLARRLWYVEI